jgi:hypothetical protein
MRTKLIVALCGLAALVPAAGAWTVPGHSRITRAAMKILPETVPAFFRADADTVSHMATDPDAMKQHEFTALRKSEGPEHYIDLEFLQGQALPVDRFEYMELLDKLKVNPSNAGFLPYSITEGTQRLTVAFAEYRQWPQDPTIQAKIGFYAGLLSHYAGDLAQPLHTTIHHDGRAGSDSKSPHSGIHLDVDSLFEVLPDDESGLLEGLQAVAFENLWTAFHSQLQESHRQVDRVYTLEAILADDKVVYESTAVASLARERYRIGAQFIASLFLTAWEDSAAVELPWWLEYPGLEKVGRRGE